MIRQHKGFSLLEVLIAFTIMAMSLTIILRIFGSGINNTVISEEYTLAVQIAESLMATTGITSGMEVGETTGIEDNKFHWLVSISMVGQVDSANQSGEQNQPVSFYLVNVKVSWENNRHSMRSFELHRLKFF